MSIDDTPHHRVAGRPSHPASNLGRLHSLVGLGPPRYSRRDIAEIAGLDLEQTSRWWRAMGFPEAPTDDVIFSEDDLWVAKRLKLLEMTGLMEDDDILRMARLNGTAFSRLAEAQMVLVDEALEELVPGGGLLKPAERLGLEFEAIKDDQGESRLEMIEQTLIYVWRRHFLAAMGRWLVDDSDSTELAVGFADLSGFTKFSETVESDVLALVVDAFEKTVFDVVSLHEGRIIKLIGDEVMFVHESFDAAVDIVLEVKDRLADIDPMPPLHSGLAYGQTVALGGDIFGPTVNLAARLTSVARGGSIMMSQSDATKVNEREDLKIKNVGRGFTFRGIGSTKVAVIERAH